MGAKGKKEKYYHVAKDLFVKNQLSLSEISKKFNVSVQSLGIWSKDGEWKAAQEKYLELFSSGPDIIRDIAFKRLNELKKIPADEMNSGHADELSKYLKILNDHIDPRDELKIKYKGLSEFGEYLKKINPELAAQMVEPMIEFLENSEDKL